MRGSVNLLNGPSLPCLPTFLFCQIQPFTKYFEGVAEEEEGHGGEESSADLSAPLAQVQQDQGLGFYFYFFHTHLNDIFETESAVTG